jgi:hypothetical protein
MKWILLASLMLLGCEEPSGSDGLGAPLGQLDEAITPFRETSLADRRYPSSDGDTDKK